MISKDNIKQNNIEHNKKSKFFVNNNFAPTINIESPIININNSEKDISAIQKITKFIYNNQKGSKNSKLELQDLPTSIKNINDILHKKKK